MSERKHILSFDEYLVESTVEMNEATQNLISHKSSGSFSKDVNQYFDTISEICSDTAEYNDDGHPLDDGSKVFALDDDIHIHYDDNGETHHFKLKSDATVADLDAEVNRYVDYYAAFCEDCVTNDEDETEDLEGKDENYVKNLMITKISKELIAETIESKTSGVSPDTLLVDIESE